VIGKRKVAWVGFQLIDEYARIKRDAAMTPQEGVQKL
jgi:hypothetical protein